jgi:hypothetical protein
VVIEYSDSIIALLLAVVFGLLGAFGAVSQSVTSGGILTTLALLAVVILRDRINENSLDREIRRSASQSRELLSALPAKLAQVDVLSGSISELRGIVEGTAMARVLRGSEVQKAHAEARARTDRWIFKGGTGTYLRAVTLPRCAEAARHDRRAIEFAIEIINPANAGTCERYEHFRRSVSAGPDGTGDTWYRGRARLESYATILAACWYRQRFRLLDIQVAVTGTVSTFRFDMSSEHLIITQDDARFPALLIPRDKTLFDAYRLELRNSFEQAERVELELADQLALGDEPAPEELRVLLDVLGLSPRPPLGDEEAAIVIQKALHAKDPYQI